MKAHTLAAVIAVLTLSLPACILNAADAPKAPKADAKAPKAPAGPPKVGDKAPLVEGKNQDGKTWKLASAIGKKIVLLYFYPKDDTPGCTKEACGLRDRIAELKKDNVEVIGVSFDSAESHQQFIEKYKLNFPLVADTDGKVADAYGARAGAGKNVDRRVSFLIGLDGKVAHVTDSPQADTHLNEMKDAVAKLKKKN
jgi:thioredoxin-dependent peroxiredoxin